MKEQKRVVIAEDQTIVRQGLRSLLTPSEEFQVVAEAGDGLEAIQCVQEHRPDLILIDLSMPKMGGIEAIREIKRRYPETKVMALTIHKSEEHVLAALEAGADGYCIKDASQEELYSSLRDLLAGKRHLSAEISEKFFEGHLETTRTLKSRSSWETLTKREKEVLRLVGSGRTSRQIAEELGISPKTAEKHRANIMRKLDLHNTPSLTAYAMEKGLLP